MQAPIGVILAAGMAKRLRPLTDERPKCLLTVGQRTLLQRTVDGMLAAVYTGGYGFFRFFIEYFREPDADLGYRIAKDSSAPIYTNTSLLNFSTGQILCFLMMLLAIVFIVVGLRLSKKEK